MDKPKFSPSDPFMFLHKVVKTLQRKQSFLIKECFFFLTFFFFTYCWDVYMQLPSVHIQIHSFSFFKSAEIGCHFCLLHGLALQIAQALHKLNALVIFATHESLFSRLQIQLLKSSFSQQSPVWKTNIADGKAAID